MVERGVQAEPGAAGRKPDLYQAGTQLPGTVYRVVRHLATGGMGSVYDVEDVSVGKRYVLKTLHPQLIAREDLARRMEAEARTLAKLQHPNIVDVVTAGITTDVWRMPFYVMERLNGQNLRVVLDKKGALEPSHCFRIAIDVLDALEHAHENQVLHRDVKPENIFLHRNISGMTITKLLDFGIMRLLDGKSSHTQGKFVGTLRYASPEQVMGGALGPASDIYALGVVLYEMLAGRGPFDDAGDAYAVGLAHAKKAAPPLSAFVRVPPSLAGLEALVMRALAKEPSDRPRDAFTFASQLRRLSREQDAAPHAVTAVTAEAVLSAAPSPATPRVPGGARDSQADRKTAEATGTSAASPQALGGARPVLAPPGQSVPASPVGDTVLDPASAATGAPSNPPRRSASRPSFPSDPAPPARQAPLAPVPGAGRLPPIDRDASTRPAALSGATRKLALNGTMIDDGDGAALNDALGERMPFEVFAEGSGAGAHELRFPPITAPSSATGPTAGEAPTRPPEHRLGLSLVAVALFTVVVGTPLTYLFTRLRARDVAARMEPAVAAAPPSNAAPSSNAVADTPRERPTVDRGAPVEAPVAAPVPPPSPSAPVAPDRAVSAASSVASPGEASKAPAPTGGASVALGGYPTSPAVAPSASSRARVRQDTKPEPRKSMPAPAPTPAKRTANHPEDVGFD